MSQTIDNGRSRDLELALARVERADRQLVATAESGYRRARSAALSGAVVVGLGAALIGIVAGSDGRRRLASGVIGIALPFIASALSGVVAQVGKSRLNEEKEE